MRSGTGVVPSGRHGARGPERRGATPPPRARPAGASPEEPQPRDARADDENVRLPGEACDRQQAARSGAPPEGTDIDFAAARRRMVDSQLRARGVVDERVLLAMETVPREEFVPRWMRERAYADQPLEIGGGQTISQPYVVAATLEAANLGADDRLLDVGTGSGYAAAVASLVVSEVFTIERLRDLGQAAQRRLRRFGFEDVRTCVGDGSLGWPEHAPYDAILAAAAGPVVPNSWKRQLRDGGRIIAPIGPEGGQLLTRVTRHGDAFTSETLFDVRYVPLIGEEGFAEQ